ncbi:MAG TPA: DUF308 domain-containing protein [Candidatus Cybelea sp.]|jgi:uncharacterized membrane protein HdeD (DUF308 family)
MFKSLAANVADTVETAHKQWGWFFALGLLLVATGVYAIINGSAATIASVVVLGAVLFFAGVAQVAAAFFARGAGHVFLLLLVGAADIIVGMMLFEHPGAGALTVTLLLAALFVFSGMYRFFAALWLQFPNYGWVALSALVSVAVGVLLWLQWPTSAMWFIGFVVGVNFIVAGLTWAGFAWKLKELPT